jgi:hypothetical protein
MITAKWNLSIQQGESVRRDFQLLSGNNTPLNLSAYTATSEIRVSHTSPSASAVFTASIPDPVDGTLRLELSPTDCLALTGSCYFYDIRLDDSSGSVLYPIEGKITVSPSITRG